MASSCYAPAVKMKVLQALSRVLSPAGHSHPSWGLLLYGTAKQWSLDVSSLLNSRAPILYHPVSITNSGSLYL